MLVRCGIELILYREAGGDEVWTSVHPVFEVGYPADQIVGCGMTVVVGDVLPQPTPERLDGHQVGAVARQRHKGDVQACCGGLHGAGAMVWGTVPDHDQPAGR